MLILDMKQQSQSAITTAHPPPPAPLSHESREALKYSVLQVSRVVVSVRESVQIVEELLRAGQPVGLDGEGVNLGPKGQMTLLQMSTVRGEVIIFDVQTTPAIMTQGGLQRLLESEHIIKVSQIVEFMTSIHSFFLNPKNPTDYRLSLALFGINQTRSIDELKDKKYFQNNPDFLTSGN